MTPPERAAGLVLVLAAAVYDGLLTLAILFAATVLVLLLNDGEPVPAGSTGFRLYLLAAAFPYFGWCWVRGGQTLGMRAWRLRLVARDGAGPTVGRALLRYLGALLSWAAAGLGFLWMLADPQRMSWHDRISGTRVVREG